MTAPTGQSADQLFVAQQGTTALVHVVGRGSYRISTNLKQFGMQSIEDHRCSTLVINLAECSAIDSTFMGILARLASRIRRDTQGNLVLINLSDRTGHQLSGLGLDQLVEHYPTPETPAELNVYFEGMGGLDALPASGESEEERAETMLDAHEALVDYNPENLPKFSDVLTFLREDLGRRREEGEPDPGPVS